MTDHVLRAVDVVLAFIILVGLSPVLLTITVAARLIQGSPVFYRAPRVGMNGIEFRMQKFRTMAIGSDTGFSTTVAGDGRVTALGRYLRTYKLDELPQLVNVLRGEMSLVGPRPQVRWAAERYDERARQLLTVRPGMTDLASVWFRNEAERLALAIDADQAYLELIEPGKTALALFWVDNRSLRLYLTILHGTVRALLGRDVNSSIVELTGIDADAVARGWP